MEAKQNSSSPMAWVLGQTGQHKGQYVISVCLAMVGVAFSVASYFVVVRIVQVLRTMRDIFPTERITDRLI